MDRRRVLALLGASAALGAGCGRLEERGEIVPYVDQPEGSPPGMPRLYASSLLGCPGAPPVLVTTREGRPVKLEGNPEHPASLGALDAWGQSAALSLYDPDRVRAPRTPDAEVSWEEADAAIRAALDQAVRDGKRILLFTPALVSPTARRLVTDFTAAYPTTTHLAVETFHAGETIAGQRQALGTDALMRVDWEKADVVVSLEADFLGPGGCPADQRVFAARRRPEKGAMNRLWCVEGVMSLTGASADHRLPLRPALQDRLVLGLLHAVVVEQRLGPLAGDADIASALAPFALGATLDELDLDARAVQALVSDLLASQGRSAILAGDHLPASVHALVAALDASLGNLGSTLKADRRTPSVASPAELEDAVAAMRTGNVAVVVDLGANPVFILPDDLGFVGALEPVPLVVSSCLVPDETAALSRYVLPAAHDLESWGDTDLHPGVLTLQQPVIRPLFSVRQSGESLLQWLPAPRPASYYDYLKARWEREVYQELQPASFFVRFWHSSLHDGFVPVPAPPASPPALRPHGVLQAIAAQGAFSPSGADLVLSPSYHLHDGRFANRGWLQEMPHPITAHVWGNAAFMGVATAARLGCSDGDGVEISVDGRSLEIPVVVMPGVADEVVQVDLGYGRRQAGAVGSEIGVDAGLLRASGGDFSPWIYTGVSLRRTGGHSRVIRTQEHHDIRGRNIVVEGTQAEYRERPDFVAALAARDTSPSPGKWQYGQKWGMVIDLSACTGCNGCVVACMAENNIPVVGPEQVDRGREMHWIRVDRYYRGDPEEPREVRLVHQPMLCQHCDNAPCENVCPVAATTHSPDGLNEMTYNRCVGTRYCANNCPYKVRRFNYLSNHRDLASPRELVFNPEVTVRPRGVMEKCTFCVQRLRAAQRAAKREGRNLRDGEVRTACQQACPTGAIAFGDLGDPESRVSRLARGPRGYHVLAELGVKPSITYLARMRNPHPDLSP